MPVPVDSICFRHHSRLARGCCAPTAQHHHQLALDGLCRADSAPRIRDQTLFMLSCSNLRAGCGGQRETLTKTCECGHFGTIPGSRSERLQRRLLERYGSLLRRSHASRPRRHDSVIQIILSLRVRRQAPRIERSERQLTGRGETTSSEGETPESASCASRANDQRPSIEDQTGPDKPAWRPARRLYLLPQSADPP
jgi:hypothetical protein